MSDTADFFRSRLHQMIDLRHPLVALASHMPWQEIEASIADPFARQVRAGKTQVKTPKLYSLHSPDVQCINKGKSRSPFEFGAKVGIALTYRSNLIVGARAFAANPFDAHTLNEQLEQADTLMKDTGVTPTTFYTDLGYRDVDHDKPQIDIRHRGETKALGEIGDHIHTVLCATGYNICWLLRMITEKGLLALLRLVRFTSSRPVTLPPTLLDLKALALAATRLPERKWACE